MEATSAAPPVRSPLALTAAGCRAGGVVALALDPARALLPALAASWDIGATVVLVPPALGPAELRAVAAGLSPTLIVSAEGDGARIAGAAGGTARSLVVQGLPPLALIARPPPDRPPTLRALRS